MANKRKRKNPIPSDNGDGVLCYRVTVPNSLEWRRAFRGALYLLTRGRYWDEETGNLMDALQITDAIYQSLATVDCDCAGITEEQITTIIQETIDNMTDITINNYVNGCQCGGSGTTTTTTTGGSNGGTQTPPDWNEGGWDISVLPPNELPEPTDGAWLAWKCNASQHLLASIRATVQGWVNLIGTANENTDGYVEVAEEAFAWMIGGHAVSWQLYYYISTYIIGELTVSMASDVINWIDANNEEMSNSLYCANTATEAYQAMMAHINGSGLGWVTVQAMRIQLDSGLVPYHALWLAEVDRPVIPSYALECNCDADPVEYDFDVTFTVKTGEPYMQYITSHPTRAHVKQWWGSMNASDAFPHVEMGISHNGVKQIVEDELQSSMVGITLQYVAFDCVGAVDNTGDWGTPTTCADGYDHSIEGDSTVWDSGIIFTCPDSVWYGTAVDIAVDMTGSTAPAVEMIQHYLDTVGTGVSEGHILRIRLAGQVTL